MLSKSSCVHPSLDSDGLRLDQSTTMIVFIPSRAVSHIRVFPPDLAVLNSWNLLRKFLSLRITSEINEAIFQLGSWECPENGNLLRNFFKVGRIRS